MKRIYLAVAAMALILGHALAPMPAAAEPALNDETIFAIFDQANTADITTGRIGWKNGHSEDVRDLALMVVRDHTAVQGMGRELAAELNLVGTPPSGDRSLTDLARTAERLVVLVGPDFDAAYLRYEIAFHAAVIAAVKTQLLPAIRDARFRALVAEVLPGFEKHLAMTKQAAGRLGITY